MNKHKATLKIDSNARRTRYDPMIFGGFLEHFDNQIYGGVFEPGSPLADKDGFRLDVIKALKELKMPVIRWPGGCFVDAYHWQKGVGETREPYGDFRWGVIEPNTFGTHEFVRLCRRLGAEPYICHNGVSDPQENIDWVDYCNATEGKFAELRKANGQSDPINVKYWSVGNERYDKEYVNRVRDTAKAMKETDPSVLITCSGSQGNQGTHMPGVQPYLMETAGEYLDYVSVHNYWLARSPQLQHYDYATAISRSEMPDAYMRIVIDSLKEAGRGDLKIAFDEWNLRAWQHPGFPRDSVDDYDDPQVRELVELRRQENDLASQYTMGDALFSASFLNACLRHGEHVTMANIAPLVNTRGPLFVYSDGIVKRTTFHVLAMYANLLETHSVKADIESDRLKHNAESVAMVDAIATVDEEGEQWSVALTNRHPSDDVACAVILEDRMLEGTYTATILTGDTADAYNDIDAPDRVVPAKTELAFKKGITSLPPHSLTIVGIAAKE